MSDKLWQNKLDREEAFEWIQLVEEEKQHNPRFWEVLALEAATRCGQIVSDPPKKVKTEPDMTDSEAIEFGSERTRFGKYMDVFHREVPVSWFVSLFEQSQYIRDLKSYMKWRLKREHSDDG